MTTIIYLIFILFKLLIVASEDLKSNASEKNEVLFQDPDDFSVSLLVKDLQKNEERRLELTFNSVIVADFNLTADQVRQGYIEISPNGTQDFVVDGRRLSLGVTSSTILSINPGNSSITLNLEHFKSMKLKDIEDDPNLIPQPAKTLKWKKSDKCNLTNLEVFVRAKSVALKVNDVTVSNLTIKNLRLYGTADHFENEGLALVVINPHTCKKTLERVMLTADFGGHRELTWALDTISPGRLVVLASLREGASLLSLETRSKIEKYGSFWINDYLHHDAWLSIFTKGGRTHQEVIVLNTAISNSSIGGPISSHLNLNFAHYFFQEPQGCLSWPKSRRWRARKVFCDNFDGFSDLCSCENPFEIPNRMALLLKGDKVGHIPMIIVAGTRTRHLFHLFQTIAHQKSVIRENFLLVTDDYHQELAQLAFVLDLKLLVHKPEGENVTRISRTFRFALFNALKEFPEAEAYIVLEDDLIVAPDFYSYMNHLLPIFEMDSSIFCVNAYNHLAYPHTSKDPTLLYRVTTFPAYGWMMSRKIVSQIVPRWLPTSVGHDWDFFIGSQLVREDRECVIPDVNRSYHWSTMGFHVKPSLYAELAFLSRTMTTDPNIILPPLERLLKKNYEREYLELLESATPIEAENLEEIDTIILPGKSYVTFVEMNSETESPSFRLAGDLLHIWDRDIRDVHNFSWRINYRNSTLFVVGVPVSPYKIFQPRNISILQGSEATNKEIDYGEFYYRASLRFADHKNNFKVPVMAI